MTFVRSATARVVNISALVRPTETLRERIRFTYHDHQRKAPGVLGVLDDVDKVDRLAQTIRYAIAKHTKGSSCDSGAVARDVVEALLRTNGSVIGTSAVDELATRAMEALLIEAIEKTQRKGDGFTDMRKVAVFVFRRLGS